MWTEIPSIIHPAANGSDKKFAKFNNKSVENRFNFFYLKNVGIFITFIQKDQNSIQLRVYSSIILKIVKRSIQFNRFYIVFNWNYENYCEAD